MVTMRKWYCGNWKRETHEGITARRKKMCFSVLRYSSCVMNVTCTVASVAFLLPRSNCSVRAWDPNWNARGITNTHACLWCRVKCLSRGGTFHTVKEILESASEFCGMSYKIILTWRRWTDGELEEIALRGM
jgi:hypothetical protein